MILGTAGHIDHGKTALVRALTGIDCDRLDEEKRRGITIELGFAFTPLPNGEALGIVDVPGHERFVKAMVSGAGGMDMVMLVIAADEGIMPQTREHMEICALLGISAGFVALTKCDLVDADWLGLVLDDIADFTRGTFLDGAPVFQVSAATGQGIEDVRRYVCEQALLLPARQRGDVFRLPIDRVFTLKGHGTVVTGTVVSGSLRSGEEVMLMPAQNLSRARSLQCHGKLVENVTSGHRCAINVQGLEVNDIERGYVLTRPHDLIPSRRWIVRLACLESSPRPLRHRAEIHFHHGTRECLARMIFFGRDKLAPGESALAEVRFREDMVGVFNDHCVLRGGAPLRTLAGGVLIDPMPPQLRGKPEEKRKRLVLLESLSQLQAKAATASDLLETALALRENEGAGETELKLLTGLDAADISTALRHLCAQGKALCFDEEKKRWISAPVFERLLTLCLERTAALHARDPLTNAFARGALTAGWADALPDKLAAAVLGHALRRGRLVSEGNGLRLAEHKVRLAANTSAIRQKILDACRQGGASPPNMPGMLAELEISEKEALPVLKLLCEEKALVKVREGLYYDAEVLASILEKVAQWFQKHESLDIANLKEIIGLSRRYLIALMEYMDKERITVRVGDARKQRTR
ncbi:MAG: selenocysteine-specific translation elongation factor [Desulfovibrio sp.]|jgi:selenocysteine-specific elongation factor|nr:selenocysteine-specific translation elongation factor [Desulfovibrio sp.]